MFSVEFKMLKRTIFNQFPLLWSLVIPDKSDCCAHSNWHWVPLAIAFRKQSQIHNAIARLLHQKDLPNGPSYAQNAHQSKKQHKMQRAKGSQCHGCATAI